MKTHVGEPRKDEGQRWQGAAAKPRNPWNDQKMDEARQDPSLEASE